MGTEIQGYNLSEADFKGEEYKKWNYELKGNNDILSITKPKLIKEIHANFINAGADIIETNTFNSNATSQSDYGLENIAYELNFQSAKIAKEAAIESSKKVPYRIYKPKLESTFIAETKENLKIGLFEQDRAFVEYCESNKIDSRFARIDDAKNALNSISRVEDLL